MYRLHWNYGVDFRNTDSLSVVNKKLAEMHRNYIECAPTLAGMDTETTGIHIIKDKPFLLSFGFANNKEGWTYTVELDGAYSKKIVDVFYSIASKCRKLVLWNVKFDLHMMQNKGMPYPYNNYTDALIYCRLASDAVDKEEGGIPVKLKTFAMKYITPNAKKFEYKLKIEREAKRRSNTAKLKLNLAKCGQPPEKFRIKNEKTWTTGIINAFFKDKINDVSDLPSDVQKICIDWLNSTDDPDDYSKLNRENVIEYAHYDVVFTIEAFIISEPVAYARKQEDAIRCEEAVTPVLYKMERVGFAFDKEYALECKRILKDYIIKRRQALCDLAGCKIKSTQREAIKTILLEKGLDIESTNKHKVRMALDAAKSKGVNVGTAEEFIKTLEEVRTLEKWYSTYILKWLNSVDETGRVYTQFNQVGAVTGRLSSDFQQFPSKPIKDVDGNVLFHPRRMVKITGDGYDSMWFLDFSAEELRFQALYTMLVGSGDLQFCRAFIPLNCHREDGTQYNPKDTEMMWSSNKYTWYRNEDNEKWHPTDLHAATAHAAFPDEPMDTEYFKNTLRKKYGKPTNFACVYGASINTLVKQFGFEDSMAKALHEGFYKSYPKIQDYANWVNKVINYQGYIANLFNRRYYNCAGHKARNYLVQGSAADYLKLKLVELDTFLTSNNLKSRIQSTIHDEVVFEIYKGEEWCVKELRNILQDCKGTLIPMVSDPEVTYTYWNEKEDVDLD